MRQQNFELIAAQPRRWTKWMSYILIIIMFSANGCKKFVEIDPLVTRPSAKIVYSNSATAASVMTGIYSELAGSSIVNGALGISYIGSVTADDMKAFPQASAVIRSAYTNTLLSTNVPFWSKLYYYIYTSNSVLENLEISPAVSEDVKKQLQGEAKFMRAFCYFYLVNFFGDVPLVLTTDYRVNSSVARTDKNKVYEQIISDLNDAKSLLNPSYVEADAVTTSSSTERLRPNKSVATALLARAYLYTKQWAQAEQQATELINNSGTFQIETNLNKAFLKASKEAIWQLQPVRDNFNTHDGSAFILTGSPNSASPGAISDSLLKTFEAGDKRKINWIGQFTTPSAVTYNFPYKYKVKNSSTVSEYLIVLRLAEQYLIRSEARAQQTKITESISDLNVIRSRAGLPLLTTATPDIFNVILHERRVELFTESAHRWLDLKRTDKVDEVMSVITPLKGGTWNTNWKLFPIPVNSAIIPNTNIKQNQGYN